VATGAVDLLQGLLRLLLMGVGIFGIVLDVGVAGHALHLRVHPLGECRRRNAA
jgi:hypothetical protein